MRDECPCCGDKDLELVELRRCAICREEWVETRPDPVRAAAPDLLAALEAMVKSTDAYTVHGEDCSRTEECDEARDNPSDCAPHGCLDSKEDDCPSCECGITAIVLANEMASDAIAKAKGEA